MTQEAFKKVLDKQGYSYKMERDNIVVTHNGWVFLDPLETLPPGVEFRNRGNVHLTSLETLPPGVQFENGWNVYLTSLETLPPGVEFNNGGNVILNSLTSLPPGVEFNNRGRVNLESLVGGWFDEWYGNIKGIKSHRLLNKMISLGLFNKRR